MHRYYHRHHNTRNPYHYYHQIITKEKRNVNSFRTNSPCITKKKQKKHSIPIQQFNNTSAQQYYTSVTGLLTISQHNNIHKGEVAIKLLLSLHPSLLCPKCDVSLTLRWRSECQTRLLYQYFGKTVMETCLATRGLRSDIPPAPHCLLNHGSDI